MENILSLEQIKKIIPIRKPDSNKTSYGKVLIIASSSRFTGSGYICASACMRAGSGLVSLAVQKEIFPILAQKASEIMVLNIDIYKKDFENLLKSCDCIAIGPGMNKSEYTKNMISYVLQNANCPIIFDADALNIISTNISIISNYKYPMIFTPHEMEFSRLSKLDISYIKENKVEVAKKFAKEHNLILVLKGHQTVISDGNINYISNIGTPAMASAGMGDCLCGMITSFIGQKIPILDSVKLGVYLHSYIANELSKSMYSILASDIIEKIPYTLKELIKE